MFNKETYIKHECFGYLASILGLVAALPQVYKTYKSKDAKSFSLIALTIGFIRGILWLLHGYYIGAKSGMLSALIGIIYVSFLLYAKLFY